MIVLEIVGGKKTRITPMALRIIKKLMQGHELIIDGPDMFFIKDGRYSCPSDKCQTAAASTIMHLVNELFLHSRYEDRKARSLRISLFSDQELIAYHSTRVTIQHAINLEDDDADDIDPPKWWDGLK